MGNKLPLTDRYFQLIIRILFVVSLLISLPSKTFAKDDPPGVDYVDSIMEKLELIPVLINGAKDNRINIVIMNRWSSTDTSPYC